MHIRVHGIPAPQGSKRHVGNGVMIESSRAVGPWREAIRSDCARQREGRTFGKDIPLTVMLHFYMPRPAGHYGTGKNAGILKPSAPDYPAGKKNDLDKLERAVMDGLTAGGAWYDDGQVVTVMKAKLYADGREPGCEIWIVQAKPPAETQQLKQRSVMP